MEEQAGIVEGDSKMTDTKAVLVEMAKLNLIDMGEDGSIGLAEVPSDIGKIMQLIKQTSAPETASMLLDGMMLSYKEVDAEMNDWYGIFAGNILWKEKIISPLSEDKNDDRFELLESDEPTARERIFSVIPEEFEFLRKYTLNLVHSILFGGACKCSSCHIPKGSGPQPSMISLFDHPKAKARKLNA